MKSKDPAEFVLQEITRRFYQAIKAQAHSNEWGAVSYVSVDFTKLPPYYNFAIPGCIEHVSSVKPKTINALDFIRDSLPGLRGYAENAGMRRVELCVHCGKCLSD